MKLTTLKLYVITGKDHVCLACIVACFILFQVTIPALNDSNLIGMCLYNVVILGGVGLTLTLLLEEREVLRYGVMSGCLILGTTLTQMMLFVPKVTIRK